MNILPDKLIIAHRGESFLAPENTLAAINMAWQNKAMAVEIDVQITKDNELAVIHDDTTKRTGNKSLKIKEATLAELKQLDVGSFKDKHWKAECIPSLSEVLQTIPKDGKLIIEIKSGSEIIPKLVSEIKQSNLRTDQIEIISFNYDVMLVIKKLIPEYKMLWLLDFDYTYPSWLLWINKKNILKKVKHAQLDGINVWAGKILNKSFVNYFKQHSLLVYTWTVNNPTKAMQLFNIGVDAVATDRAQWLKKQLLINKL